MNNYKNQLSRFTNPVTFKSKSLSYSSELLLQRISCHSVRFLYPPLLKNTIWSFSEKRTLSLTFFARVLKISKMLLWIGVYDNLLTVYSKIFWNYLHKNSILVTLQSLARKLSEKYTRKIWAGIIQPQLLSKATLQRRNNFLKKTLWILELTYLKSLT